LSATGEADNVLDGGAGDDVLSGGEGNDILIGGEGNDQFEFADGDGMDVITDFDAMQEVIQLTDVALSAADVLTLAVSDGAGNTVIDFGDGDQITLSGVEAENLSEANFEVLNTALAVDESAGSTFSLLSDDDVDDIVVEESTGSEVAEETGDDDASAAFEAAEAAAALSASDTVEVA